MPRTFPAVALIALAAGANLTPCNAEPAAASPQGPECVGVATEGPEAEAIRRLELRGAQVNVEGWGIAEAQRFFAPDFVGIQPNGTVAGLEAVLAGFIDGRSRAWARSFDITDLDIRVIDCVSAIVVGTAEVRALAAPADSPPVRIRFLNIWRKADGRWQYWANQFTRMATESSNDR